MPQDSLDDLFLVREISAEKSPVPALDIRLRDTGRNIFDIFDHPSFAPFCLREMRARQKPLLQYAVTTRDMRSTKWELLRSEQGYIPTLFTLAEDMRAAITASVAEHSALQSVVRSFEEMQGHPPQDADDDSVFLRFRSLTHEHLRDVDRRIQRITTITWSDAMKIVIADNDVVMHRKGINYDESDIRSNLEGLWHKDSFSYVLNYLIALCNNERGDVYRTYERVDQNGDCRK